ncbi:MAG TPA: heavy metal translocating P-type ATPase [Chitinophagales bacterium]|nr:heavy metal translocating P-type ATPase [Chitinophagales bacterium]
MEHQHKYDNQGKQLCCNQVEKIYDNAGAKSLLHHNHDEHGHSHDHDGHTSNIRLFLPTVLSLLLLLCAICFDHLLQASWFVGYIRVAWFFIAYLLVGFSVLKEAFESIVKGDIFSEFLLMGIATIGAFAIGEFEEGVTVMLFYSIGEIFQTIAVKRAKLNIKTLIDQRPDTANILVNNQIQSLKAEDVNIGDIVQLKPGEKLALDGELLSDNASFNTAALTGESKPDTKVKGDVVLAGMINLHTIAQVKITTSYTDSKLSKIINMIQDATTHKAPTELFIRKFARIYTPIVVLLAVMICFLPAIFINNYQFKDWLYRSLIFLVISCPCALVISIPLGYFGGIGAASRNGILFKGSNFLDKLASIQHVVMDKTGTLTKGVFKVQEVQISPAFNKQEILDLVNAIESHSTHPVASAIHQFVGEINSTIQLQQVEEISGHGLKALHNNKMLLVGNFKLLNKFNIAHTVDPNAITDTVIAIALDNLFVGFITIADEIKDDAQQAIKRLHQMQVQITMLSGDKSTVVQRVASSLQIKNAFGDLLPEDKVNKVKEIKSKNESVAFVGDGVNDAPVVALSDVGIAMGGLGSDATIETADVVIQNDEPSKIATAIQIGKQTKKIVWQNISLAFAVKLIVLLLGAGGVATMWEAVFADVGVALLAIVNAVRIQQMKFDK